MDKTIRRNELCIVGLPRCDFVFSSTRTCFIAYGFENSPLEMTILKRVLEEKGIQAEEAGGTLASGQNAFCAKICSKIITSQFCAVLLNNEVSDGQEIPSANVNMEYGLMLGFNKYIIPFQRASQKLPFNVAGLDTIKYEDMNFESQAAKAVMLAIEETQQDAPPAVTPDQVLEAFLLTRKALVTPINTEGERNIYQMGEPLGFNLLNDFSAMNYMFLGNFTALRAESIIWRVKMLIEILNGRLATIPDRIAAQIATPVQVRLFQELLDRLQVWIVVTNDDDKRAVAEAFKASDYHVEVYSMDDITQELEMLR